MDSVTNLITEWQAARAALAAIERAERPDVTDRFGRVWTWFGRSDTYRHCGTACPVDMIDSFGLPSQRALDNPNYDLCGICLNGRTRNVPDCKPEWNCSHTMHQCK
ncbi:hypothetical protein [Streptomyces sp. OK228]|uniref:hypothetical protein n=1 Tax=Streptomyces sp. OK228 TaxID=1882786 RepID=UPI000BD292BA|nr:hypothetical protein [Streptomyces sp. OK228]SOE25703.1 hypothetical protein SAMN05442782_2448 [Streptomyces sp. OK228]